MEEEVTENGDKNRVEKQAGVQGLNSSVGEWAWRAGPRRLAVKKTKSEFKGTGHFEGEDRSKLRSGPKEPGR